MTTQEERFGPFVLIEELGRGGHGSVHLARFEKASGFEKLIALKRIHPNETEVQERVEQLVEEAKLAARIQHANIVQVFDLGEIDGEVFVAMELVRGKNIASMLRRAYLCREQVPLGIACFIASEFLTALDFVHRAEDANGVPMGIIHGDVSPHNILVSYEGAVKVTDFGIARIEAGNDTFVGPDARLGKAPYIAPEQLDGRMDQRSDIFSAGVVIFELLTGRRLFPGTTIEDVITRLAEHPIPAPSQYNEAIPPAIDDVCSIALRRDMDARYQNMGELLTAFSEAAMRVTSLSDRRSLRAYMHRLFGLKADAPERRMSTLALRAAPRTSETLDKSVVDSLVAIGMLTEPARRQLDSQALARHRSITELLLLDGSITESVLLERYALETGLEIFGAAELATVPIGITRVYPRDLAERTMVIPVRDERPNGPLVLAACVPYRPEAALEARVFLGAEEAVIGLAPKAGIRDWIDRVYQSTTDLDEDPPEFAATQPVVTKLPEPVVLLADRDVELTRQLTERLAHDHCCVISVHDGRAAAEVLRDTPPVVALLDAALPGVDGYTLLIEHRARREAGTIFITSTRDDEFRQAKALELGADDFIAKPIGLTLLVSKIRRELNRAEDVGAPRTAVDTSAGVSGSLGDMNLGDIVRVLEMGQKTAHVVIDVGADRRGEVAITDGRVVGVQFENEPPLEAFRTLVHADPSGRFHIVYGLSTVEPNVTVTNTVLLIDAEL